MLPPVHHPVVSPESRTLTMPWLQFFGIFGRKDTATQPIWLAQGSGLSILSADTIRTAGDFTRTFQSGVRLLVDSGSGDVECVVDSSSYAAGNTDIVVTVNDGSALVAIAGLYVSVLTLMGR